MKDIELLFGLSAKDVPDSSKVPKLKVTPPIYSHILCSTVCVVHVLPENVQHRRTQQNMRSSEIYTYIHVYKEHVQPVLWNAASKK